MSKAFEMLEIGITPKGDPFYIPRHHTLAAGSTGTGKTEVARKIVSVLRKQMPDLKVLIFDVKSTGRDWQGYGTDVPVYVETATDSRFLRDLIETQEGRKIDWFFYELHIACTGTETWEDVLANLRRRYEKYKDKNQFKEEKLGTLIIYMEALTAELSKGEITGKFELSHPITVVPLNYREEAFKQLAVYSYLTAMKKKRVKRVLIVCDEMSTLAPSKSGTGCKKIIEQFLFKQGRAAELFGLAIDQEITGISPSVRRQCWNWILGMQTDTTAQKRTIEQIPGKKLSIDDISTLGVGWWWSVIRTPSSTRIGKFYLIPEGVHKIFGEKLVKGEMSVEEIMEHISNARRKQKENGGEDEELYKAKFEEEQRIRKTLEKTLEKYSEDIKGLQKKLTKASDDSELKEQLKELRKKFLKYAKLEEALKALMPKSVAILGDFPRTHSIGIRKQDLSVTVKHEEKIVEKPTTTLEGKVMYVIVTHFQDKEFTEKELTPFLEDYGWYIKHTSLAPLLGATLKKQGLIVKVPGSPPKYRLPKYVKVNVKKTN